MIGTIFRRGGIAAVVPFLLLTDAAAQRPGKRITRPQEGEPRRVTAEEQSALEQRGVLWDTEWAVDTDGATVQWPNPSAGGATDFGDPLLWTLNWPGGEPVAQMLCNRDLYSRRDAGAAAWVTALLRAPGDLLGCTDAERHFAQLGIAADDESLRRFASSEVTDADEELAYRGRLERRLAACVLRHRGVEPAAPRSPTPLLARLVHPIATADAWVWVDTSRWTADREVQAAVRRERVSYLWRQIRGVGGGLLSIHLAGAQMYVDQPGEVMFEVARCLGPLHVDQVLLALRREGPGWQFGWMAMSGAFDPERIAAWLTYCDVAFARGEDGSLRSSSWFPGVDVSVTRDVVEMRRNDDESEGNWPDGFAAAASAAGAAFAVRWQQDLGILPDAGELVIQTSPLRLRVEGSRGIDDLLKWLRAATGGDERVGAWARAFASASTEPGETFARRLQIEDAALSPAALWPLLCR